MNVYALVLTTILTFGSRVAWRRGARPMAFGCAAGATLFGTSFLRSTNPLVIVVLLLFAAAFVWHRWARTAATVTRWGSAIRRKSGVASGLDIFRHRGAVAMRRRAGTLRPSLALEGRSDRWAQLAKLPVSEVAVKLCRVGATQVLAAVEEVVIVFGGPRMGKSQWLAGQIVDAPGAVIATSTRTDLLDQVGPMRARRGPVYVFNPVGLGGRESTVTFDPLVGCEDPVTASERATDMLAATGHGYHGGGGDREFWDDQGRRNLAALMHAATLAGDLTMADVQKWLSDLPRHQAEIIGLLHDHSPEPAFESAVTQFIETNERTRSSITSTIAPALAWITHGPARDASLPVREGGRPLDISRLLAERGTIFMLGGEENQVAPLVCGMTGWVAREARRLAAFCPGGRLDPPLALRLDEAALICPIPLHQWTADMGGRGVSIVACVQSRAQLVDRYGDAKASAIINNSGARVLFGGTGDRDDLNYWSTLAGERDEPIVTTDLNGRVASRSTRRVPVLAPAQIATLPQGRVVVFTSTIPPVVGRAEQAFRRFDVRAHHAPDAITVRARLVTMFVLQVAGRWVGRQASALGAAAVGLWLGLQYMTGFFASLLPEWAAPIEAGGLGVAAGLSVVSLWRYPGRAIAAWLLAVLRGPVSRWVVARRTALRARFTGLGPAAAEYRPFSVPELPGDDQPGPLDRS